MESGWDLKGIPQMSSGKTGDKLKDLMFECPAIPTIDKDMLLYLGYLKPFIKWLVDNDKIDIVKLRGANGCPTNGWCREIEGYSDEECLLMLLAIQNEPLIFLISILR